VSPFPITLLCVETSSGGWVSFEGALAGTLGSQASSLTSLLELLSKTVIVRQDTAGWGRSR
jgi:hypothetical protein